MAETIRVVVSVPTLGYVLDTSMKEIRALHHAPKKILALEKETKDIRWSWLTKIRHDRSRKLNTIIPGLLRTLLSTVESRIRELDGFINALWEARDVWMSCKRALFACKRKRGENLQAKVEKS